MRFLVDANLSPRIADRIRQAGHDAVHVSAIGLITAEDDVILDRAAEAAQVIVTGDADFGTLLALGGRRRPSVILLRSSDHLTPDEQADLVLASLEHTSGDLEAGAVASLRPGRIRLRLLPVDEA
jgi:predicted nuclease of predicted toxin-antitoxin system